MYRILAIEDDPIIRQVLSLALPASGYECILAPRISLGLEACAQAKPDLILMDINLPDGSGLDACRKLNADVRLRHIPVLMITGEARATESRVEGFEAGADDYILKPFDTKELLARIKGVLAQGARPTRP